MPSGGTLLIETADVVLDEDYASAHISVKPGAYVRLTVTDTGTGMTPQVQARLFEPFFTTKEPGKGTGLVVEDMAGLRDLAKRRLERLGYTVFVAANAEEALTFFERHPSIDVLLTDVVMPGASGPDLTRQLMQRRPTLKVIYMSGSTEDAIVHHGVIEPGIAFLNKPFGSDARGRKIREVVGAAVPSRPPGD